MIDRNRPLRNKRYLQYIRSLPCVSCGAPADDAHHLINMRLNNSGTGTKPGDEWCIPACRQCHNAIHASPALQSMQHRWYQQTAAQSIAYWGDHSDMGIRLTSALRMIHRRE